MAVFPIISISFIILSFNIPNLSEYKKEQGLLALLPSAMSATTKSRALRPGRQTIRGFLALIFFVKNPDLHGGGEENRTPVQRHYHTGFSERSLWFRFRPFDAHRQASLALSR